MNRIVESQLSFESGGRAIRLDCYAPENDGQRFPAIIGLHGSGGGYPLVMVPGRVLAAQGFAVYVLHYFHRTDTSWVSDRATILRSWSCMGEDRVGLGLLRWPATARRSRAHRTAWVLAGSLSLTGKRFHRSAHKSRGGFLRRIP